MVFRSTSCFGGEVISPGTQGTSTTEGTAKKAETKSVASVLRSWAARQTARELRRDLVAGRLRSPPVSDSVSDCIAMGLISSDSSFSHGAHSSIRCDLVVLYALGRANQ